MKPLFAPFRSRSGRSRRALAGLAVAVVMLGRLPGAAAETERELIEILRSDASPARQAEACRQLRQVGTAQAVPALASLLTNERVAHAARYALEGLPGPAADAALREGLGKTSGLLQAGLADSLGWRRDVAAAPLLIRLLTDANVDVASAAAAALGRIGSQDALAALTAAHRSATGPLRSSVTDALLRGAQERLSAGETAQARSLFEPLTSLTEVSSVRTAALLGLIRCAGPAALAPIQGALESEDADARLAALQLASERTEPAATKLFIDLVPRAKPEVQIALLAALRAGGDTAAVPTIETAARSAVPAVRKAALIALGDLGDDHAVGPLLEAAVSSDLTEQNVGRQALESLRRGDVPGALIRQLTNASTATRAEALRALTSRDDRAAVPALVSLARHGTEEVRAAAWRALRLLADGTHAGALVELLAESTNDDARDAVVGVFESMAERGRASGDLAPVWKGAMEGSGITRRSLLRVCALFPREPARRALRAALQDPDDPIRSAGAKAVAETRDPALLPDLINIAERTSEPGVRSLALAAIVRLATEPGPELTENRRTELLSEASGLATTVEDKRQVLSGLARVPNAQTLALAEQAARDASVKPEADAALLQITQKLGMTAPFIEHWQVCGPFRKPGITGATALFDVPFGPELAREKVTWRPLPRAGQINLAALFPGQDQCVAYLRAELITPAAGPAVLLLGSDDGVKAWLNGQLVHANNVDRGDVADQDRAPVQLLPGTNMLQLKITQGGGGWSARARLVGPDGRPIPGLRTAPSAAK